MWGVCFTREGEGDLYRGWMHVCGVGGGKASGEREILVGGD